MNERNPQISILLPTYNQPTLIRGAIEAVLNQTYKNFEFIISNNCSPNPEIDKICREYAEKDSRIKYYLQKENIGCEKNTAFCLSKMSNNLFFTFADDDIIEPTFIEKCLRKMQATKGAIGCWSKIVYIDEDRNPVISDFGSNADLSSNNPIDNLVKWIMLKHWMGGALYDYSVIKNCDTNYKKVFGWDVLYTAQMLLLGKIPRVEEPLYIYQIRTKSQDSKRITAENMKNFNEFSVISLNVDIVMRTFEVVFESDKLNIFQKIEFFIKMWLSIFRDKHKFSVIFEIYKLDYIKLLFERKMFADIFYLFPYIIYTLYKRTKFNLKNLNLIKHKVSKNSILLVNNNHCKDKNLIEYSKIFINLGYNVDILSRYSHKKHFKNIKKTNLLKIKGLYSYFLATDICNNYEFLVFVDRETTKTKPSYLTNEMKYLDEFINKEEVNE